MGEFLVPNPQRCGIGKKEKCCIFLVLASQGFQCARDTPLGRVLFFRNDMSAKRAPVKPYPECQLEEE
ncbi:MAG: hypothetical protein KGI50_01775 [Patescibacteria group bacterium]|nr:hypothetical protein [Patescibacteria group bacterium]MDE2437927.1 hypothetical protein [Patescibacteria group bacterium]